ncbi:MAG: hypothetical protein MJZ85_06510 [Bacteroidales bacterium]|nr:hypothetical protein [Bacteroidales bacterium]
MFVITEKVDRKVIRVSKFKENDSIKAREKWVEIHDSMKSLGYCVRYWDCNSMHAENDKGNKYHAYFNSVSGEI